MAFARLANIRHHVLSDEDMLASSISDPALVKNFYALLVNFYALLVNFYALLVNFYALLVNFYA